MTDEKELQEKMLVYRTLEARLEVLVKQKELLTNKLTEILSTVSSIKEISKNNENVLFKLGSEAYIHGNIADKNKILVEIGAGVVLEKSVKEGEEILNKRKENIENTLNEIQNNIQQISDAMNRLAPEINELIQKMQSKPAAG